MRKLASIQQIGKIESIENADFIEKATILGWTCVIKKGTFKEKDKCVFFEIDSILPEREEFEFMRKYHFHIRTVRLRKVLSQGLAMPLSELGLDENDFEIGQDVTDLLNVKKYIPFFDKKEKLERIDTFPYFIPKTDEIRIQSEPGLLNELQGFPFYISLKLNGTSMTVCKDGEEIYLCSRNFRLSLESNSIYNCIYNGIKDFLYDGYAYQGEIVGPRVQKNELGLDKLDFYIFDIFNIKEKSYFDFNDIVSILKSTTIRHVPIVENGDRFNYSMDDLLEKAKLNNKDFGFKDGLSEGIVVRPMTNMFSSILGKRLSFKVINNDYLSKK